MAEKRKIRILLVDDSAETREYLSKLLQFETHTEVVGMAANGQEAVKLALDVKPDLILMDINMPVMDGISAAEIISRRMPGVRVVMMSVQSEMAYLRRAMQAGAREFLTKPFTHDQLLEVLGEVSSLGAVPGGIAPAARAARPPQVRQATVVAFFSPRGGAGCSTLALNLAVALQGQRAADVLLVDGNFRFGALDAMLNLEIPHSIADLLPALDDADPDLLHAITIPHTTGIRLLAAPPSPEMADLVSVQHLEKIVAVAKQRYEYIVIDVGSRLDDVALFFMDKADRICVLLTPDIPAIRNVRLFLDVAQGLQYREDKILLVLNRAPIRGGINAEAIQRHLRLPIVVDIPDSPRVAQTAINRGVPLLLYERDVHKEMPVTRRLLALAEMMPRPGRTAAEGFPAQRPVRASRKGAPPSAVEKPKKRKLFGRLLRRGE